MYDFICGTIYQFNDNVLCLEQNNYGYEIYLVTNKRISFKKAAQIKMYTFLKYDNDACFQWFGFLDLATKKIFGDLLTIPTIGVKTAVKVLQQISVENLLMFVQQNNIAEIEKLQGLKTHSVRLLLQTLQKIYFKKNYNNLQNKVISCLKELGYSLVVIYSAINSVNPVPTKLDQYLKIVLFKISQIDTV
ncbi:MULTISPECIES: Holliday junction branch migration protein RuvA [Spiroplasma]|uniref:Holliday junction branch migration protein RuvA n=1 Tax=Spiroplasma TaxID=2132 RepID=UPI0018DC2E67|nr:MULTISPECIES: Holliday junction branch migration protein RuvA [Spiroplasma]MBH8622619.1 Holliday junction DNA helicase RuvA [Spiroplasma sp. hyd1]UNF61819.1 Holliday junction DNA helicase RuvA [Spiroplasma poulsonii]